MHFHVKSSSDPVSSTYYEAETKYDSSTYQDGMTGSGLKHDAGSFLLPGLLICVAAAYIAEGKYFKKFRNELVGSLSMVALTYTLCNWFGASMSMSWKAHSAGHVVADLLGGSSDINPAMTVALLALGYVPGDYTEAFVRIAGQVAGGLLSFPLCRFIFAPKREEFDLETGSAFKAFSAEMVGTSIYCFVLLWVTYQLHYGKAANFIINKLGKSLTRKVIFMLTATGPAMNPVLATAWDVFGVGRSFQYPNEFQHFFVYWVAPLVGASLASLVYSSYLGGTWFGHPMSAERVKAKAIEVSSKTKAKLNENGTVDRIKSKAYEASAKTKEKLGNSATVDRIKSSAYSASGKVKDAFASKSGPAEKEL